MPCIRQTSMTDDPGATLCAKIRSFSSMLQRRRRSGPVSTSPRTSRALIRALRRSSLPIPISPPSSITPPPKPRRQDLLSPLYARRGSADAYARRCRLQPAKSSSSAPQHVRSPTGISGVLISEQTNNRFVAPMVRYGLHSVAVEISIAGKPAPSAHNVLVLRSVMPKQCNQAAD